MQHSGDCPPDCSFSFRLVSDAYWCTHRAVALGRAVGLRSADAASLGVVVAELVTNAVKYAGSGVLWLRQTSNPRTVVVEVHDRGPGFNDPQATLKASLQWSEELRSAGQKSLGCGLGAVQRLMDWVEIRSDPAAGTVVRAGMRVRRPARP